ncbi:MAG: RNA polymerase sigma-54 factor, partial [Thermoguttaceae bacterium]|nr:RNA polymerase sigma-54 factor [Thermoguttaceae bacterium]
IRSKIKEMVDAENKSSPLSDDAIAETLQKQGFDIARRTVAKYRQELNIPSSRQRKSWVAVK